MKMGRFFSIPAPDHQTCNHCSPISQYYDVPHRRAVSVMFLMEYYPRDLLAKIVRIPASSRRVISKLLLPIGDCFVERTEEWADFGDRNIYIFEPTRIRHRTTVVVQPFNRARLLQNPPLVR